MVYDSYWSRKADPAVAPKRRCVWVTRETNRRDSPCEANSTDNSEGYEKFRYETGTERSAEEQEKNREEEERIWLEWQSAGSGIGHHQSHAEVVANSSVLIESAAPSAARWSRKRSLTIDTDRIVEDVALNSAGQELNWDPFLPYSHPLSSSGCIGTGSFTWEKSLQDEISEVGDEQDHEKWEERAGVLEHIIDPRLLAKDSIELRGGLDTDAFFSTC